MQLYFNYEIQIIFPCVNLDIAALIHVVEQ